MTPREYVIWLKGFANGKTLDGRGRRKELSRVISPEDIRRIFELLEKVDMKREPPTAQSEDK